MTFIGGANGVKTSLNPVYLTTVTQPNGGPTSTFLTSGARTGVPAAPAETQSSSAGEIRKEPNTSGEAGTGSSEPNPNHVGSPSEIFYTTGFTGLRTLSATGVIPRTLTSTLANGAVTTIVTTESIVSTRVYSGAPEIAMTTISIPTTVTSTGVEVISGSSRAYTSTIVTQVPTAVATPVLSLNAAEGRVSARGSALVAAIIAGAALIIL